MIPKPGETGSDTWAGDSWKTGGGDTWLTGSYDPELNLIYWGTGNPAPDFNGDMRKGDNLYTESMIALEADARYVLLPIELRFEKAGAGLHADAIRNDLDRIRTVVLDRGSGRRHRQCEKRLAAGAMGRDR